MDEITECPEELPAGRSKRQDVNQAQQPVAGPVSQTMNALQPASLGVPPKHRMQRSAVRPFLCCGSELSLVSLMDNLELSKEQTSGAHSLESNFSICDYENTSTDHLLSCSQSCSADLGPSCASAGSLNNGAVVCRIKSEKHKSKRRFWSLRFRSKWTSGFHFSDRSRQVVCGCENRKCNNGMNDSLHETESACCCNTAGHQSAIAKSRKSKTKARRASMVNLPRVSDFDRILPISGNEEIVARERAREMRLSADLESRMLALSNGPALRAMAFGASATSSAMGLLGTHTVGHLQGSLHNTSDTEELSSYTEFTPVMPWPTREGGSTPLGLVIHTQIDYIHFLVPDLEQITNCSFYWGVIDRYEAERLLDKKREGTFLLRDSAQDDFLFSVSFRRYNRSLHARIEQWNHRFSFDVHDPAVFSSDSVCSLIEHYKDSSRCLFFEPMLTEPLHRNFPFSLQHMARAVITSHTSYDAIHQLPLPNSLKEYIRYYHYKQKVCVRRFESPQNASLEKAGSFQQPS